MVKLKKVLGILAIVPLLCLTLAGCVAPLTVEITSPEDGAELTEGLVTVTGTVSDPEATITINGIEGEVTEDGSFSAQVELTEGENIITAVAVMGEQEVSDSITVIYTPTAPSLSLEITSPQDGTELTESLVMVNGTVSDPEAAVTVNEDEVEVAEDGTFSSSVELVYGENTITVAAMLEGQEPVVETITVTRVLAVEITSPEDGAELTEGLVTVTGTVSDPEATITIDDEEVEVAGDGSFSADVELVYGENTITVTAMVQEQQVRNIITVSRVLAVGITSPQDGAELAESPATVSGTVSDPEAIVTVNGIEAEVTEDGGFSAQVELTEGENTITAVAVMGEQEVSDSITVTYSPAE